MNWQPTCELRWVILHFSEPYTDTWNIRIDETGKVETHRKWSTQILQQKWVKPCHPGYCSLQPDPFEWRDVPVEKQE